MTEQNKSINLHDIAEVLHESDVLNVNRLLQAGWFLIDTYKREYEPGSTSLVYALGWLGSKGKPYKPDKLNLGDLSLDE